MIDELETRRLLGVSPQTANCSQAKYRYRTLDYVVVRCDVCQSVYGKDGRVLFAWVLKRRRDNDGKDICHKCWWDQRNPFRSFDYAKKAFSRIVNDSGEIGRAHV